METTQAHSLSLRVTHVHKFVASRIEETAWENPVFKLAPYGSGQLFAFVAPDLCVPGVPGEVLQQVISQASWARIFAAEAPFSAVSLFDRFYALRFL